MAASVSGEDPVADIDRLVFYENFFREDIADTTFGRGEVPLICSDHGIETGMQVESKRLYPGQAATDMTQDPVSIITAVHRNKR